MPGSIWKSIAVISRGLGFASLPSDYGRLNRASGVPRQRSAKGISHITEARKIAFFENPDDLVNRASLNTAEIRALASADALRTPCRVIGARHCGQLHLISHSGT
jgi:hypothetical protein